MEFKMLCEKFHSWIETFDVNSALFGVCPVCPGRTKGKVLARVDGLEDFR